MDNEEDCGDESRQEGENENKETNKGRIRDFKGSLKEEKNRTERVQLLDSGNGCVKFEQGESSYEPLPPQHLHQQGENKSAAAAVEISQETGQASCGACCNCSGDPFRFYPKNMLNGPPDYVKIAVVLSVALPPLGLLCLFCAIQARNCDRKQKYDKAWLYSNCSLCLIMSCMVMFILMLILVTLNMFVAGGYISLWHSGGNSSITKTALTITIAPVNNTREIEQVDKALISRKLAIEQKWRRLIHHGSLQDVNSDSYPAHSTRATPLFAMKGLRDEHFRQQEESQGNRS